MKLQISIHETFPPMVPFQKIIHYLMLYPSLIIINVVIGRCSMLFVLSYNITGYSDPNVTGRETECICIETKEVT